MPKRMQNEDGAKMLRLLVFIKPQDCLGVR